MSSTPLRKFGNSYYEIEKLNSDKFPEFYSVRDKSFNIYVVKLYQRDYSTKKLADEAKIRSDLSQNGSPHILRYISNSVDEMIMREKYIVMEYAENGNLNKYILSGNYFGENLTKIIAWKIFHAVLYMHEMGVAHGAISAKNIFLDKFYNFKIGGFESSIRLGTDNKNKEKFNKLVKDDIIKLGILIIQLLTGKLDIKGIKGTIKKVIKNKNVDVFWRIIDSQNEYNFTPELKNLINLMLSGKIEDIRRLLSHDWFYKLKKLDKCEFEKLEEYMKNELKKYEGGEDSN